MISEIDMEMARAKAMMTGVALVLALVLSNPSSQDYQLWNQAPQTSRVNLVLASLYDGDVIGVASLFFRL